MGKLAFLYAGQGSQVKGMGMDLYEAFPAFREPYNTARLPFDLKELSFYDPEGKLNRTRYTQPALVAFADDKPSQRKQGASGLCTRSFPGRVFGIGSGGSIFRKNGSGNGGISGRSDGESGGRH